MTKQTVGTAAKQAVENIASYEDLDWIAAHSEEGFFNLVASPAMQDRIAARCGENILIYDYRNHEKRFSFADIARLVEETPDKSAYLLQNFQYALSGETNQDWNENIQRLNFSRDMLARLNKNLIFCLTRNAHHRVVHQAYDFYSFVKFSIYFEEEFSGTIDHNMIAWKLKDQSMGTEKIEIDFRWPREKLLALAISLGRRARQMAKERRFRDALSLLKLVLSIRESHDVCNSKTPDIAVTYSDIGDIYKFSGEFQKAVEWYQKALVERESLLGFENLDTTETYINLSDAYFRMGQYGESLKWAEKALRIRRSVLGEENLVVATTYCEVGKISCFMGDTQQAEELLLKALDIQKRCSVTEISAIATTYFSLGIMYRMNSDYPSALMWLLKAAPIFEDSTDVDLFDRIELFNSIAIAYSNIGDYEQALNWLFEDLRLHKEIFDLRNINIAYTYDKIAKVYADMEKPQSALKWCKKCQVICEKNLGRNHPDTIMLYKNMEDLYRTIGNRKSAYIMAKKASISRVTNMKRQDRKNFHRRKHRSQ